MAANEELAAAQRELRWHWRDCQVEIRALYPKERPANPKVGDGWFNEVTASFSVWDGHRWVSLPVD